MVTKKHNHPNKGYTTDGKLSNEDATITTFTSCGETLVTMAPFLELFLFRSHDFEILLMQKEFGYGYNLE